MDLQELYRILSQGEGETVEFKERGDKIAKDVVAFLNTKGGVVIVGVNDRGELRPLPAKEKERIEDALSSIEPPPHEFVSIQEVKVNGGYVFVVKVKPSPYLHFLRGRSYARLSSTSVPLSWEEVARRLAEVGNLAFDEAINPHATLEDIDKELVMAYLKKREEVRGVEVPPFPYEKVLRMIGVLRKDGITNGGLLFFSPYPQSFFPQAVVRIRIYRASTLAHEAIVEGSLWQQWREAVELLERFLPRPAHIAGLEVERRPAVHPLMLREGLANAIIHRNYLDRRFIEVEVREDHLLISNPGGFPPKVDPNNPIHDPRNPLLSRFFYDVGIVDKYGSGIERMREVARATGYPEPMFLKWRQETILKIPFFHPMMVGLSDEERALLALLLAKERSSGELASLLGKSQDTILRLLDRLMEKGLVERIGRGRGTRYKARQF